MNRVDRSEVVDERGNPSWTGQKTDTLRAKQPHLVHVSPHLLLFDPRNNTATLTFSNPTDRPVQAEVQVLFTYPAWPHGRSVDTTIITSNWMSLLARDTAIFDPAPTAPFAGRWLLGLPPRIVLAPHQTQQVTVTMAPPANLPAGEYWARVVVVARPPLQRRTNGAKDVRPHFAMPVKVWQPDTLRDSTEVFFWQGAQRPGRIAFGPGGAALVDSSNHEGPHGGGCRDQLWFRLPVRLTGTTHAAGRLRVMLRNVETGQLILRNIYGFSMYRTDKSAMTHWWGHLCCFVAPGKYRVVVQYESSPERGGPSPQRLAADTATYTIPTVFEIRK